MKSLTFQERALLQVLLSPSVEGVMTKTYTDISKLTPISQPTVKKYMDRFAEYGLVVLDAKTKNNYKYLVDVDKIQRLLEGQKIECPTKSMRIIKNLYLTFPIIKQCEHCESVVELLDKSAVQCNDTQGQLTYTWICPCCGKPTKY